ncbi:MAG: FAD-binding protein, partial [Mesorhizobium sp.]
MIEQFDAIVVGAGMSGNAAAYTLASQGLKVLQLERGEYPGSKNVQGAIMYANMLEKIIPDFRDDAPLERHLVEQRLWVLDDTSHTGIHYRSDDFNGKVIGVRTDRAGGVVFANVVVLAEGVSGLLGTRAGLREMPKPETVALAVKEMHFLPEEVIGQRFGVKGDEGCVIEAVGTISRS